MEKISNIIKTSSEIEDEIEKKLYCIKSYEYKFDEEFKNKFGFQFDVRSPLIIDNEVVIVKLNNVYYKIEKQARLMTFIYKDIKHIRFIYSGNYLKKIFKDYNIERYSTKNNNSNNSNDSIGSEIPNEEILELFQNMDITNIYQLETNYNKIIELFKKRYILNNRISDLSLNAGYYYSTNANDQLDSIFFQDYIDKFNKYIWNESNHIIYFIGPKGVSKSLFLMYFCLFHNIENNPTLYINYKTLKNLGIDKRKNIFKKEIIYLFFDEDKFKDFYKRKFHRLIKREEYDIIHNLTEFIQKSLEIYENTFEKKITLVIDNFDETDENIYNEMEKLIKLINSHSTKIRLIISGYNIFIKNKFKLFLIII